MSPFLFPLQSKGLKCKGDGEETATGLDTNFITDDDPGFVDFDGRDYGIRPDAPLYKKIPDFIPPPFYKMGTVDDFAE